MSQVNPPDLLALVYPAGATVRDKLQMSSARLALTKFLGRVPTLTPLGFADPDPALIDVQLAIRECLRRDAPTLDVLPESALAGASCSVLSRHVNEYLGSPVEGYLSVLTCWWERELSTMGCLPWLRVAVRDAGWADDLWRAGARDFVFAESSGKRVFGVIHDDHDDEISVIGTEAVELLRRAAGRG